MATDHDGNTLNVNDNIWVPCQITAINAGGQLALKALYSGANLTGYVNPSDSHKAGNFPDRP